MQRIRKIDFPKLWKCINSNVNNNAWNSPEFHPVPVVYWDEMINEFKNGWIVLPIQLLPPKRGGVCRFIVSIPVGETPIVLARRSISLAKYLQSNAYKARCNSLDYPLNIWDNLYWAWEEAISATGATAEESRSRARSFTDRYAKAIGE